MSNGKFVLNRDAGIAVMVILLSGAMSCGGGSEDQGPTAPDLPQDPEVIVECDEFQRQGRNTPETRTVEMGEVAGVFRFDYETYTVPDQIIIRHSCAGAPKILSEMLSASIINAGDGAHEHPTQALLDAFTIRERKGVIEGLKVLIVGDITHSRVVRSNILLLLKMGAEVTVSGPRTMVPLFIEDLGVSYVPDINDAVKGVDVITMLRIQLERQGKTLFPTLREYSRFFGLNRGVLKNARDDVLVMHPGPVNRGVEISPDVLSASYTVILDQVENGVAVRMALMYLLTAKQ